ncbi:MAG: hypothetical protein BGO69_14250 [Bacteroidetes bacterium 46-16]|nr:MAG: hypothetical protein BGO69_14250 [Bacteroidetes bacterium 46-16]
MIQSEEGLLPGGYQEINCPAKFANGKRSGKFNFYDTLFSGCDKSLFLCYQNKETDGIFMIYFYFYIFLGSETYCHSLLLSPVLLPVFLIRAGGE